MRRLLIAALCALFALATGPSAAVSGSYFFGGAGGAVGNATVTYEPLTEVIPAANASLNTKGSATASMGTTAAAWSRFRVYFYSTNSTGARFFCDLSSDNGSTWTIQNLFASTGQNTAMREADYEVGIAEPAGSVFKARCQSSVGSASIKVAVVGQVGGATTAPGYTTFAALNPDLTNTRASASPVPFTATWTSTGVDPTASAYSAISAAIGDCTTGPTTSTTQHLTVQLGAGPSGGGSEVEFGRWVAGTAITSPFIVSRQASPNFAVAVASGVRISAKITPESSAGTDSICVSLYGLN